MQNPRDHESEGAAERPSARCSFCQKDSSEVGTLVEGPSRDELGAVYICRDCVELCASIFEQEKQRSLAPQDETAASDAMSVQQKIDEVLGTLSDTEREVVKLRYGLGDGYTYTVEEVARGLEITPDAVQEIENRAVAKLQSQNQPPPNATPAETQ